MAEATGNVTRRRARQSDPRGEDRGSAHGASQGVDADMQLAGFVIVKHGDGEVGLTRLDRLPRIEGWPESMGEENLGGKETDRD